MKIVSLELAKTLKEKGFPQKGNYFNWVNADGEYKVYSALYEFQLADYKSSIGLECAAPTADEILDLLPEYVLDDKRDMAGLKCGKWNKKYWTEYHCTFNSLVKRIESESLADALAEMWLYLKEPKNIVECQKHKNK